MKRPKKQRKVSSSSGVAVEVKDTEDWCFACKDGGDLMLCDYGGCPKVYHAECVGREESGGETAVKWSCDRHSCLKCQKVPWFHCYTCPNSVCRKCVIRAQFLPIRGKNGLCDDCWELVRIVEGDEDPETNGEEIDLKDRDTYECLFKEYWDIVKDKEDLTMEDIYSADARSHKQRRSRSKSDKARKHDDDDDDSDDSEGGGGNDDSSSDSDLDDEGSGGRAKKNNSKGLEFVGWGSKPLINFLASLGKSTVLALPQEDVESIIYEYVEEKKLWHETNKNKIVCDDKLYTLVRCRSLHKVSLSRLLEPHFTENMDHMYWSKKEEVGANSHSKNGSTVLPKKPKAESSKKSKDAEAEIMLEESCFASIVAENIKLVYLKKSLIEELLHEHEGFEAKVVGSFVRVKNDPKECLKRNSHQLFMVEGIMQIMKANDGTTEFHFQVCGRTTDVHISKLSDCDFDEDDIEDLRQRIENGLLPRILVADLEEKARCLHEDVTKHWIKKELDRLQTHIDFANDKGWRREHVNLDFVRVKTVAEHLARRELLKKPAEQERLLQRLPRVIAERVACNPFKLEESPKSILRGHSAV